MTITAKENSIGAWAFLIGLIIAIIIGLSAAQFLPLKFVTDHNSAIYAILVVLGLVVGFSIRVAEKDSQNFLFIGAIIVIVSKFGMESVRGSLIGIGVGDLVTSIFGALLALFVPATIIVAIKTLFGLSKV